jgi:hypothetical protein
MFETPPSPVIPAITPPKPPMVGESIKPGQRPKQKSMQTTFLGADTAPTAPQLGAKTLLGQ